MEKTDPVFKTILEENTSGFSIRKKLIEKIQDLTGHKLLVYVAHPQSTFSYITKEDALPIADLLRTVPEGMDIDLMINSPGGDPNAAEKILTMIRAKTREEFNVIIPDYAKSAATMIALGSDKILMGYSSELGPIDPQLIMPLPSGQQQIIPARAYVDGLDKIRDKIIKDKDPQQIYYPLLSQIRPEMVQICQNSIDAAREFATTWLKKYMLKDNPKKAEEVATILSEGKEYKSHGKLINYEEATSRLGLKVELIDKNSDLWNNIWELYCRSIFFVLKAPAMKLFENENYSFALTQTIPKQATN